MSNYKGLTSRHDYDSFVNTPKSINIPQSGFKKKPNGNSFSEMRFPFTDGNGMTIAGWSMLIQVKDMTRDMCKETYIVFHETDDDIECVFRLDITPKNYASHRAKNGDVFHGSHFHELDQDTEISNDFEFECFEQENRRDWLNFVAERLRITIIEPQNRDMFGGWEWTA